MHPHIKTHRAREVARWGDPLRSGLLPFAWAIGTGRFCAHAATCRSAYAGLPCGHGLGNTDRSDFHRLIRKVSAAFSASVFPCQFWKMNKPQPASMGYASKAAQAGFDPASGVLRTHSAPYKNRPVFCTSCCISTEIQTGRLHSVRFIVCHTVFFAFLVVPVAGRTPLRRYTERVLTLFILLFALLRGWMGLCGSSKILHFFCFI